MEEDQLILMQIATNAEAMTVYGCLQAVVFKAGAYVVAAVANTDFIMLVLFQNAQAVLHIIAEQGHRPCIA